MTLKNIINTTQDIQMDNNELNIGQRKKTLKPNCKNISHVHYTIKNIKTI